VGAHVHQVTREEYGRVGSETLGELVCEQLRGEGKAPYFIPVGGSNALGTWGYLEAVREMEADVRALGITDVVVACGSGGTAAGLALGVELSGLAAEGVRVSAFGVCDSPAYFHEYIDGLLGALGAEHASRDLLRVADAKGAGYAVTREEELATTQAVAMETGVVLDPVYSGKAVHSLLGEMRADPRGWEGRRVLFVHTGGLLGLYDKVDELQPMVAGLGRLSRLEVPP